MLTLTSKRIAEITKGRLVGDENAVATKVTTDSRKVMGGELFVALKGERFDGADYLKSLDGRVSMAITHREEEVSYPQIIVKDTLEALTELSRYHATELKGEVLTVSLTGSVGKTTTKEMTASVLAKKFNTVKTEGNLNNHIGTPLTLLTVRPDTEALVLEMGMSHKGEIEHLAGLCRSDIAMITCIGHSHIENLGSRENISDAKKEIIKWLKKEGTLIVNGDEPLLRNVAFEGRVVRVGMSEGLDVFAHNVKSYDDRVEFSVRAFGVEENVTILSPGRHNVLNSLFAISAGLILGLDFERIKEGLLEYRSVGLRQDIYEKNGVSVIADCYNASVESMIASLSLLSEKKCEKRRIAVLADMLELGDESERLHRKVGEAMEKLKVDFLFTYGNRAKTIFETKPEKVKGHHFDTKEALANALKETLVEGDMVLFKASRSMKLEEVISLAGLEK